MRRKLLAAAIASACAAPAMAQMPDGLQIYGRVNVTAERITVDDSTNTAVQPNQLNYELVDNSSRIGLRYKKELVPGNSILFQIESRVNLTDGGDVLSSRDSYVGLAGDSWGAIRLGRTIGPVYYATYDYISMHNYDTGTSSDALLALTAVGNAGRGNAGFMNNTIWFTSPKFGGFTIDFAFSLLGEDRIAPGVDQPRHIGLVGSYDAGPLHLAVSYANTENQQDIDAVAPGIQVNSDTAWTIGAFYDFKSFVVGAVYERAESDVAGGTAERNYWRVALMVPFGQHELHFNVGGVDHRLDANLNDDGALHAFYTTVDNDTNGNYIMGGSTNTITSVPGAQYSSIAIGVRHNF